MSTPNKPFWETKTLAEMTRVEWESLCDGCGKCCLNKLLDEDADETHPESIVHGEDLVFTFSACDYLDLDKINCTDYENRTSNVPTCIELTPNNLEQTYFMPSSCAYRRLYEGRNLPSWHPLLHDGDKQPMHDANMSVKDRVIHESDREKQHIHLEDCIVSWPLADCD